MIPRIYVPSRGRADDRLLRGPSVQAPHGTDVVYVVGPDEIAKYSVAILRNGLPARVVSCEHQPNISAVRWWIGLHAQKDGLDRFVIMDDDVGLLVRKADDNWQLRGAEKDDVQQMLQWMWSELDRSQNVGISPREGNNRVGVGNSAELTQYNTRAMRVQGFQTEAFLACEHGRVRVMEDFDISLQILAAGGQIAVNYFWAQGQRMTNESGGCSEWRTHEIHEASARRLAELHPGIVTLRQKSNKTDKDGFGTRTEVTIQWKRAYLEGQKHAKPAG